MTICSLVIQTKPQNIQAVNDALNMMKGVEVHAQSEHGKMVVSIDHPSREYCSKVMTDMTYIQGVMSTSLVYEYQEDLESEQTQIEASTTKQSKNHLIKGDIE